MSVWEREIRPERARARCAECGSTELAAACHECGAGLCADHLESAAALPWYRTFSDEFVGLNLEHTPMGQWGHHCRAHRHYDFALRYPISIGVLLGFIGFLLFIAQSWRTLASPLLGWIIVALGLCIIAATLGFSIIYAERRRARQLPSLPVLGRFPTLHLREYLLGGILLDARGAYASNLEKAVGRFEYSVRFTQADRARKQLFRRKYGRWTPADLSYHAGFLVGKGTAALRFQGQAARQRQQANTIELSAPLRNHGYLNGLLSGPGQSGAEPSARFLYPYIIEVKDKQPLPVQLIPTLVAEDGRPALELLVQMAPWPKVNLKEGGGRVTRLQLCVPEQLGEPVDWNPSARLETEGELCKDAGQRRLVWENVPLTLATEDSPLAHLRLAYPCAAFYIRFENYSLLKQQTLRGQLDLRLENKLLSGLEGLSLYYPLGQPRRPQATICQTDLYIAFELHLGALEFRGKWAETRHLQLDTTPDHSRVLALVSRLESDGIYAKRVLESPPQTSRASARRIDRAWEVDGRRYYGVYPLDFQLAIGGFELYEDEPRPVDGQMTVTIRVEATLRKKEMYEHLVTLLQYLTTAVLAEFGSSAAPRADTLSPPEPVPAPSSGSDQLPRHYPHTWTSQ